MTIDEMFRLGVRFIVAAPVVFVVGALFGALAGLANMGMDIER